MAAKILNAERDSLNGNVKLMFQPAEESPGGALPMIKAGILTKPKVDAAFALHLWNDLPVGKIGVRSGPVFAGADEFLLTVIGKGGHGAAPHQTKDPIVIAAQIVATLQTIVSRKIDPLQSAVVTVASIHGGTAFNIIPEQVTLKGTFRTFEPKVRQFIKREIERIACQVAAIHGATCKVDHTPHYPPTINDKNATALVEACAAEVVGKANIASDQVTMGAEDMSFVLEKVPGSYFVLGSANAAKGLNFPHHSSRFDFDEEALPIGVEMHCRIAERFLNGR